MIFRGKNKGRPCVCRVSVRGNRQIIFYAATCHKFTPFQKCSTGNNKKAKKPVAKKIEEKVKLPKPPTKKPDVIVLVHGNDPYKKFAIALQIAIREFRNIVAATQLVTKKSK